LTDYLGSDGASVEIVCTENNSVSFDPGKQSTSLVNGLFLADSVGSILQTEFNVFVWWDLSNGYVLGTNNSPSLYGWRLYGDYGIRSVDQEPYPVYYVFRLLSRFAAPSDVVIDARSQSPLLAAYATRRADGRMGLMLINKSPDQDITAQISIAGFRPSSSAVVYSYGKAQDDAARTLSGSPDIAQTVLEGASTSFDFTVTPYSVTVISLLPETPNFELAIRPSSQMMNAGEQVTFDLAAAFGSGFGEPLSVVARVDEGVPLEVTIPEPVLMPSQPASLVVRAKQGALPEAYLINVTASGGGLERTAKLTVTVLDPPVISSATFAGKKLTIRTSAPGQLPRVFVNGVEQTDRIKRTEGTQIVIKGKKRALGLVGGENRLRVVRGQAASDEFVLRL
jgi:hypothetical protein